MTESGLEDPFSCQLSRGGHVVKTAEQNSKFFKKIETTQIESKIRGDKSTVNRHEPFARINYTKAINIPVLLLDFTI